MFAQFVYKNIRNTTKFSIGFNYKDGSIIHKRNEDRMRFKKVLGWLMLVSLNFSNFDIEHKILIVIIGFDL